jgi:hypothetical protein|tara:strand:+ start:1206 stop:1649 length:444 start_codon:yes stop_codon:yes gene_type:complete
MTDRTPRTKESREENQRKVSWQRPSMLPVPEARNGIEYRWIRTSTLGQSDNTNVSSKFREGWTPVRKEDHPNLQVVSDIDSRFTDNIEVGGLLLCQNSTENVEARRRAQLEQADSQMQAVDNSYLRNSDPRMPVLNPERSTRTSFGK